MSKKDRCDYFSGERVMTSNLKNSPEFACRTCVKQHCGCKNIECPLPCHFYTEQAEQEPTNLCQNSTELVETAETISARHRYAGSFGE